jgi:uncharacterized membrane protein
MNKILAIFIVIVLAVILLYFSKEIRKKRQHETLSEWNKRNKQN